jgi:D-alanine-D-alanine ligase
MHVALTYNLKREDSDDDGSRSLSDLALHDIRSDVLRITKPHSFHPPPQRDTFAEWDSVETINAVRSALELYHEVSLVEADRDAYERLSQLRPGIVFNMAEGFNGPSREAQIPMLLELLEIPYTGSDPLTLCLCLDKARTKEVLTYHGIPTAPFVVAPSAEALKDIYLTFPLIVKPLHEGSSKGILDSSVVRNPEQLEIEGLRVIHTYGEPALVEEFLPGREFSVGMLGNGKEVRVLPIIESRFDEFPPEANPINSFEAKWLWDRPDHPLHVLECPARIPTTLQTTIERMCRRIYEILRCRDWCRIDLRLDAKGIPNLLEVNPIPGVLPDPAEHSFYPAAAAAAGLTYQRMINAVLDTALGRYGLPTSG